MLNEMIIKKLLLFICFIISIDQVFSMEKDIDEIKSVKFENANWATLPCELKTNILMLVIKDELKSLKSFNQLKEEIKGLKLINQNIFNILNSLLTEKFVIILALEINDHSMYPISPFQLAKIVLNNERLKRFNLKYIYEANYLGEKMLEIIHSYRPDLLLDEIRSLIKNGANLDYQNSFLNTALIEALRMKSKKVIINIIIRAKANLDLQNMRNQVAYDLTNSKKSKLFAASDSRYKKKWDCIII